MQLPGDNPPAAPLAGPEMRTLALLTCCILSGLGSLLFSPLAVKGILLLLSLLSALGYLCFWPYCLARNYWRRSHLVVRLAWLPLGWATASIWTVTLLMFIPRGYNPQVFEQLLDVALACGSPLIAIVCVLASARLRSDTQLVLCTALSLIPIALAVFGIALNKSHITPYNDPYAPAMFGALIIYSFIITLPCAIYLAGLMRKKLLGTTPGTTPRCAKCTYDLTGSVLANQTLCPECEHTIDPEQAEYIKQSTNTSGSIA